MQPQNPRNTFIIAALLMLGLLAYEQFVVKPYMDRQQAAYAKAHPKPVAQAGAATPSGIPGAPAPTAELSPAQALALTPRIPIHTSNLSGSISTAGAVIDDLSLTQFKETTDKNSPPVRLLSPIGAPWAYFAEFSWLGANGPLYSRNTAWTATPGQVLTPKTPVTLTLVTGPVTVKRTIAVDDRFMFTVTDTVLNNTAAPLTVQPYSVVERNGVDPQVVKAGFGVFQGAVGVLNDSLVLTNFNDWKKKKAPEKPTTGGWAGITDKYWMAAAIPDQHQPVTAGFNVSSFNGVDVFRAGYTGGARVLQPGASASTTTRLFAGAKVAQVLQDYQRTLGVPKFDSSIDWGWFFFLTRPMFWLLDFLYSHLGNFGLAILALTVVVRAVLFVPANQGFASMSKMKKLQPKVEDLKKRFANDQAKQQQEMMALYQREKINPLAGCLPILIQIPVFIALVKLLSATIEMRHAPFLFIKDLSARDPTTIWNLFGLIPWNPAAAPLIGGFLDGRAHIGIIALLYVAAMYLQQAMTPAATDPTQQTMMKFMPLIFIFILAYYPVGLMIYWIWSTIISIGQQYVLMHRHQVENPIDDFINRIRGKGKEAPA